MSERYSKLFALPENLYSAGAPVVIAAGALQKDNQTGKVFAQLKICNIQDKTIKAATIKIIPLDTTGKPIGEAVEYQYLDLAAGLDVDFGQKTPVMLKDVTTRSFTVSVSEVVFTDNSIWSASDEKWEVLTAEDAVKKDIDARKSAGELRKRTETRNKQSAIIMVGAGVVLILLGIVLLFRRSALLRFYLILHSFPVHFSVSLIASMLARHYIVMPLWVLQLPPILLICSGAAWVITGARKVKDAKQKLKAPIAVSVILGIVLIFIMLRIL